MNLSPPPDWSDKRWQQHIYELDQGEKVQFLVIPYAAIDGNSVVADHVTMAGNKGAARFAWGDNTVVPVSRSKCTQGYFDLALQSGGDVLSIPRFIEIQDENDTVPAGIPGATYVDENEDTQNNTWATWLAPTHSVEVRDGRKFVASDGLGYELTLAEMAPVAADLVKPEDMPLPDES